METWIQTICEYAPQAHWIIFCLLMLAGCNVPISEDILLLTGGALAGTCLSEHWLRLYVWIFAGCWISAWEAYWIGRLVGPKLYSVKFFDWFLSEKKVDKLQGYYERFGIFTFIIGRFIPGGVRNALFMTSGLGKMPFLKFIGRDGVACLISSATIFSMGYQFAEHYQTIIYLFESYTRIFALIFSLMIVSAVCYQRYRRNHAEEMKS